MAATVSPLVSIQTNLPVGEPQINGLVTWADYAGRQFCGRLTRIAGDNYFIKVIGFNTAPYEVGQIIARERQHIVDWE